MTVYQIFTLLGCFLCFSISTYLLFKHAESKFHRAYGFGFFIMGVYTFFIFGFCLAGSVAEAWIWLRLSAILHLIPPLSMHAILLISSSLQCVSWPVKHVFTYVPFVLFFFQDALFPELTYNEPVKTSQGYIATLIKDAPFQIVNMVGYVLHIATQVFLVVRILTNPQDKSKRRFAVFTFFTYTFPIFITALLFFVLPYLYSGLLRMETILGLLSCVGTIICLYRFNIFDLSVEIVSQDVIHMMTNFLILLNPKKEIIFINEKGQELLGYRNEELKGQCIEKVIGVADCTKIFALTRQEYPNIELFVQPKNLLPFPAMVTMAEVAKKNEFLGYIIIGNDLSKVYHLMEQKKIAELELKALLRQMNPHFLFNSLNAVQHYIIKNDEEKANEYLSKFGALMRKILDSSEKEAVFLQDEVQNLDLYLQLEEMRFAGKFTYTIHVDPQLLLYEVTIPPMLIQPFIENAIWHGLLPKEHGGQLIVSFNLAEPHMKCLIRDNGIGRKKAAEVNKLLKPGHRSTAIRNIEERIHIINNHLKDSAIDIRIIDCMDEADHSTGTQVEINFPLALDIV